MIKNSRAGSRSKKKSKYGKYMWLNNTCSNYKDCFLLGNLPLCGTSSLANEKEVLVHKASQEAKSPSEPTNRVLKTNEETSN
uniref:Uncharacterized protein n=1 Tax=Rhizophora mucronata TaxID=61149 RepID=A0A2P2PP89_RHIMU